jgi:hypothetical protein
VFPLSYLGANSVPTHTRRFSSAFFALIALLAFAAPAAQAQRAANSNSYYQNLRSLLPGGEVITVKNLDLHRDAAVLSLRSGSVTFYPEVNGKVTGAVFRGEGHIHLTPATAEEKHNLAILTHAQEFDEDFDQVVLRFTDATAVELHKASAGAGTADRAAVEAAQQLHTFQHNKLYDNIDLRLLSDVLSPAPGGYFFAAIHGKKNQHLFFIVDPHGAGEVAPEQAMLMSLNDWGRAYPFASRSAADAARVAAGEDVDPSAYRIDSEDLDTTIEKSGFLTGLATVHLTALVDGVAVVPFDLYPTLRVSKAETDKGEALDFVQEKKDEDADFGVVLPAPLKKGETATIRIAYGGKDVVYSEGSANYYPVARESWYPNASSSIGNYANYHMFFHVPKGLELIATGTKISEKTEGKMTTSEWKTDLPLAMIGFNLGKFTTKQATIKERQGQSLVLDAYANTELPDNFRQFINQLDLPTNHQGIVEVNDSGADTLRSLNTTSMLSTQLSQGQAAIQIYTELFGPIPFARIALTQQSACNYGQSWPMLVYLPICGFLDQTQQHTLGLDPANMYWKMVTPHEVAHQWWGQNVGFRSYRDQWMSEGFADASASIFLLATRSKPNDYLDFWKQERRMITEKNAQGFRPIDVGPVTMGFRLNSEKAGWSISRNLIYPKGAYILHAIQMMMYTQRDGNKPFAEMMHDFVATYRMKNASTENFKAIVEKHMLPSMDLERKHNMDWFFNEYVYGTELPNYHFDAQLTPNGERTSLHFKLTQSGVATGFVNSIPIYLELADGHYYKLGGVRITGDTTVDQTVQLPQMPAPIKKAVINYYYDVLCTEN